MGTIDCKTDGRNNLVFISLSLKETVLKLTYPMQKVCRCMYVFNNTLWNSGVITIQI